MKIALDYGHCLSGSDTGASGNGYREEVCTREIGKLVKSKLEALGNTVVVVSPDYSTSVSESLRTRVNLVNSSGASLSVSIHLNAGGGLGSEIYTKNGVAFKQATDVLNQLVAIGYRNRGIKDGSELALVGGVNIQSMLIECCFIDSADMNMYNADKIATAIVKGLTGSSVIQPPTPDPIPPVTPSGKQYLNLKPSVSSWRVYPTNKSPVVGNEVGYLSPSQYGGLSYEILGTPQADVYTIKTQSFGTVNIYAPRDNDSSITSSPVYGNTTASTPNIKYLNLKPTVSSWRVYPTNKAPVIGNETGYLSPSQYGGLSYEILGNPQTDVYTIKTQSFGTVNIYAPKDNDSSITTYPVY